MLENPNNRSQSGGRDHSDAYSKENEDSLVKKLMERLKAAEAIEEEPADESTHEAVIRENPANEPVPAKSIEKPVKEPVPVREPSSEKPVKEPESVEKPLSENARRLAERRKAMQQMAAEDSEEQQDTRQRGRRKSDADEDVADDFIQESERRPRKRLSKKVKLTVLIGLLLFVIGFGVTAFLIRLPNPERDVPRNVIRAIFSTKYMESAEIWGPLLSEETKRRSMNKLNSRIRPHLSKECFKKLEEMGLIGTVHKLAYESECNMVFTSFEPIAAEEVQSKSKVSSNSPDFKVQAYRVVIDQVDVVNKTPKNTYTFVAIVATSYQNKELIIEDIFFDDESKLPVKTNP